MKIVQIGTYDLQRPEFDVSDEDFEKGKEECRAILIELARRRSLIGYKRLAERLTISYPFDSDPRFRVLAYMVGEISVEEYVAHRPLLSALVVNDSKDSDHYGLPGSGFFELVSWLGEPITDNLTFWSNELNKIYETKYE